MDWDGLLEMSSRIENQAAAPGVFALGQWAPVQEWALVRRRLRR